MRMMITLSLDRNTLPKDYRPWITRLFSYALTRQGGETLSQQHLVHRSVKPFSFSVFLPKSRFAAEIELECDYIKVIFSTCDENLFDDFFLAVMGIQGERMEVEGNALKVSSVVRIIEKSVSRAQIAIHMLSPLVVRDSNPAKHPGNCLGVKDPAFQAQLRQSVEGLLTLSGLKPETLQTLCVSAPEGNGGCKEAHVLHQGRFYRSTLGNLALSGEPALLNLLYQGGMGEMREEGFGLFELME